MLAEAKREAERIVKEARERQTPPRDKDAPKDKGAPKESPKDK
jgi:hypothetical protein